MKQPAPTQQTVNDLRRIFADILGLGDRARVLEAKTPLLGSLPELDSMAVATILTAVEERFHILIEDDDINADMFETFGSLTHYIECKLAELEPGKH